ncbi:MAG: hypothetical protein N2170_05805 [Bacteroidia bacterium]|nr:hypothetical protein [Bacteroidia bacterium]
MSPTLPQIENFSQPPIYDSHADFYYRVGWERDSLYVYEYRLRGGDTVYFRKERLDFVIGSGHQTRSYLLWRNGFLYEAPVTWYVRLGKWDLSPGYAGGRNSRFSREIQPPCLACHASGWEVVPWTYNRYHRVGEPLGCESCHGPGGYHVRNPADTLYHWSRWTPSQQMDVCSRCHLEGIAIEKRPGWKPGDSLSAHWVIFLPQRPELGSFGIASHAERLMRSACYQKGGLTCTGCHHPHPSTVQLSYEKRCLSCHRQGCTDPTHPSTGCIGCHMPKGPTSDIPHTQFTDHYIRVVREESQPTPQRPLLLCATEPTPDSAWVGEAYLRWYSEGLREPWVLEKALSILGRNGSSAAFAQALLLSGQPAAARSHLERVGISSKDSSLALLELYGFLLEMTGSPVKALRIWETLMRKAPFYPEARFRYTLLAYQLGQVTVEKAYVSLLKLTQEQPWNAQFHYNAAVLAGQMGRWKEAKNHLRAALAHEPDYEPARQAWNRLPQ